MVKLDMVNQGMSDWPYNKEKKSQKATSNYGST